jgi:hypothetical protein
MNTPSKPRRQGFLAVALALTLSTLFFSLLVNAQSSNSPELSHVGAGQAGGFTSGDDNLPYWFTPGTVKLWESPQHSRGFTH